MRDKISAIIIDKDYKIHDYSEVKHHPSSEYAEKRYRLKILDSGQNILSDIYDFRGVDAIITIGDKSDWQYLSKLPYAYRKKWTHLDEFNPNVIESRIVMTFRGNIEREKGPTSFSFFTCTHNTDEKVFRRLYNSMLAQTYYEWDWFILDDSSDDTTAKMIESLKDPRITVLKTVSVHGNIGFNKHMIALACDGDYLVEVDHDDELTSDCLDMILRAVNKFPNSDFLYSNCLELKTSTDEAIMYGNGWGWGEGLTKTEVVNGKKYTFSETPGINPYTIRTIYAQPNHVRCWKKEFYHKIGGHNPEMSVLDDQELIIRTFLHGEMTKIEKVLYIQHEGDGERGVDTDNTQSVRFAEIQRTTMILKGRFDDDIHRRIIELDHDDIAWDKNYWCSILWRTHIPGLEMMNNFYIPE